MGMRFRIRLDRTSLRGMLLGSYTVENLPGKYSPHDFIHNFKFDLAPAGSRHSLEMEATYNNKFLELPVRGSMKYLAKARPISFEASVDFARYMLRMFTRRAEVILALGTEAAGKGGFLDGRPAEVQARVGKVTAGARWVDGKKPHVRLG